MSPELGRVVVVVGLILVVIGGLAALGVRLPLGRLPGDIAIKGEHSAVYIPLGTMLVASVVLSLVIYLLRR